MRHNVPMKLSRNVLGTLLTFVAISAALFAVGRRDYPNLHLILDTGMCVSSGLLALLLRDLGARAKSPFPIWVAISFGIAFLAELVHVLVTILAWSGPFGADCAVCRRYCGRRCGRLAALILAARRGGTRLAG